MKSLITLIALLAVSVQAQTNIYYTPGFEVGGGVAASFANIKTHRNVGVDIYGTWWQTRNTGTITRAGVNDLRNPNALIFDYTEVGQSIRAVWNQPTNGVPSLRAVLCRFSPAGTIYGGKSYIDGGTYTKVEAGLSYKFTPRWGINATISDSFSTSQRTAGAAGMVNTSWSF